jgi:hypothetical protein
MPTPHWRVRWPILTGGPAYAVMFALLIVWIAVPGLIGGLLPRAAAQIGLVLGVVGALSTLTLLASGFSFLLPIVRFGGTAWLITIAFRTRTARNR